MIQSNKNKNTFFFHLNFFFWEYMYQIKKSSVSFIRMIVSVSEFQIDLKLLRSRDMRNFKY